MDKIWIEGGNPHNFSHSELVDLAGEIGSKVPGISVIPIVRTEAGYGVSFHEVLVIWAEVSQAALNTASTMGLVGAAVGWLSMRWKRDKAQNPRKPRPRSFVLCNKSGVIMEDITIDLPDGQPSRNQAQIGRQHPRPMPSEDHFPGP